MKYPNTTIPLRTDITFVVIALAFMSSWASGNRDLIFYGAMGAIMCGIMAPIISSQFAPPPQANNRLEVV